MARGNITLENEIPELTDTSTLPKTLVLKNGGTNLEWHIFVTVNQAWKKLLTFAEKGGGQFWGWTDEMLSVICKTIIPNSCTYFYNKTFSDSVLFHLRIKDFFYQMILQNVGLTYFLNKSSHHYKIWGSPNYKTWRWGCKFFTQDCCKNNKHFFHGSLWV